MTDKYSKKEDQRKAKNQVKVYLTKEDVERLNDLSKSFKNRSYYIKKRILEYKLIAPAPVINKDSFLRLGRIGTNINQITRRINSAEANIFHRSTKEELMKEIDALNIILREVLDNMKDGRI